LDAANDCSCLGNGCAYVLPIGARRLIVTRRRIGPAIDASLIDDRLTLFVGVILIPDERDDLINAVDLGAQILTQRTFTDLFREIRIVLRLIYAGLPHHAYGVSRIPRADIAATINQSPPKIEASASSK